MLDIIIVGAGTAGLSAAIYGLRAGKSVLLFDGSSYGGQIVNTPDIENYPGIKHISGYDFATGLYQQAKDLGAELRIEKVLSIEDLGQTKKVRTTGGEYEARAVILATGARNRELGLPNEKALVGRGLSYCATCDGMFFRNRIVAVNGGGNTAVEDAFFLSNYVKKVYLIHRRDAFRAAEKDLERLRKRENVEFILNTTISALKENEGGLCALELRDKEGAERELPVDGLFVAIGQSPDNAAFSSLVELDEKGYIVAGEDCLTRTAGIFAAGDGRTKAVRQLATAAADGAVAALAAASYLDAEPR